MLRNRPEFHALDLAVLFLGATPVSIYNSSAPEQIEYLVNDCKAKVAIVEDAAFLERFLKVRESLTTLEHIVMLEDSDIAGDAVSATPNWQHRNPPTSPHMRPRQRSTTSPR